MNKSFISDLFVEKSLSITPSIKVSKTFTEAREKSDADFTGELDYDMISLMPIDEIIL